MTKQARFQANGEHVSLEVEIPGKGVFAKPVWQVVQFSEWISERPEEASAALARILRALEDEETGSDSVALVRPDESGARLHPEFIASLSDSEAVALGLPPATTLALDLRSSGLIQRDGFRIDQTWVRRGSVPVRAKVSGGRLFANGQEWRIPEPLYTVLGAVEAVNKSTSESDRQSALAVLKEAIGEETGSRIRSDGVIERLRIAYASAFSLDLRDAANGPDFDPILFSKERLRLANDGETLDQDEDSLLPEQLARSFRQRFRAASGERTSYLLDDGSLLFIDPQVAKALEEVRKVQRGPVEERRLFASSPQRYLAARLNTTSDQTDEAGEVSFGGHFIETKQFSERVAGVDIWRKPVLPWIKPKADTWLPEAFGLRIGEPPAAHSITLPPELVSDALETVRSALREEKPHFSWAGQAIPATQATLSALQSLEELVKESSQSAQTDTPGKPSPSLQNRYFLQVRDNLETVSFAPLVADQHAPATPLPDKMPASLRTAAKEHQKEGFQWLVANWIAGRPGAVLADDMGLGKTFQALAFVAWIRSLPEINTPVLVVAPSGLLSNWEAEIRRHLEPDALGRIVRATGAELAKARSAPGRDIETGGAALRDGVWADAGVVLTTYETMRDYHMSFARQHFASVFYDEAQKLKNPASQLTRAAKTLSAQFQLALTGTPVENRLQDLWSILDVVHPGLMGSSKDFEERYPAEQTALRELHERLTSSSPGKPSILLRRMKEQCLDSLPAKRVVEMPVPMPPAQAQAYEQVVRRALALKGSGERGSMLEVLHSLRGVSLHPIRPEDAGRCSDYFGASARLAATLQTLETVRAKGEKALVFCESLAMQALLAEELRRHFTLPHSVVRIHGSVPSAARQAAVDQFQNRGPGFDVMILSPKAGGVGLTLTAANHVIHLSRWWNPAVEDQATDRVYRIGQTKDVTVYLPQAVHPDAAMGPTSFDLRLHALMQRKRELSQGLLAPSEDDADTASLFDLVVTDIVEEVATAQPAPSHSPATDFRAAPSSAPPREKGIRKILGLARTPKPEAPPTSKVASPANTWPRRVVYEEGGTRDRTIFTAPIAGDPVRELIIIDPYGAAGEHARRMTADFAKVLLGDGAGVEPVKLVTFDAESVNLNVLESSDYQYAHMHDCWRRTFADRVVLQFRQLSKRGNRQLHDREVRALTRNGRTLIWDLGRGIEGVMSARFRCTVTFTEE